MFDLQAVLPQLLPSAIAWAERQSRRVEEDGKPLNDAGIAIARAVGVQAPERIRVLFVDELPLPDDPTLRAAAVASGLLGPFAVGLTLGHGIIVVGKALDRQLLLHECTHVRQYERHGSIGAFLQVYLHQIATVGYDDAPLEQDARAHER